MEKSFAELLCPGLTIGFPVIFEAVSLLCVIHVVLSIIFLSLSMEHWPLEAVVESTGGGTWESALVWDFPSQANSLPICEWERLLVHG